MIAFESRRARRIVGRLERGEDVLDALHTLAREHGITTAWLRATGSLESVVIRAVDQERGLLGTPLEHDGPCELLSLTGNISLKGGEPHVQAHVTIAVGNGAEVVVAGGRLAAGRVFCCEFMVDCFDDLGLRRELDEATGLLLWAGLSKPAVAPTDPPSRPPSAFVREPPAVPAAPPVPPAWAEAAAASRAAEQRAAARPAPSRPEPGRPRAPARVPRPEPLAATPITAIAKGPLPERKKTTEEEFFGQPLPQAGDWVEHQQFGLCRVDGESSEGGLIIRLPTGVRKAISLDILVVGEPRLDEEGDGRIIYPLRPKRR